MTNLDGAHSSGYKKRQAKRQAEMNLLRYVPRRDNSGRAEVELCCQLCGWRTSYVASAAEMASLGEICPRCQKQTS